MDVFNQLPTYLITRHETTEISVAFAAIGALLAALAIALSLLWHPCPERAVSTDGAEVAQRAMRRPLPAYTLVLATL